MQLIARYISEYKNIKDKVFNFSNEFFVEQDTDNNLFTVKRTETSHHHINNYALRVIIGNNGSGKSGILEALQGNVDGLMFLYDDDKDQVYCFKRGNYKNERVDYISEAGIKIYPWEQKQNPPIRIEAVKSINNSQEVIENLRRLYADYPQAKFIYDDPALKFEYFSIFPSPKMKSFSTGSTVINKYLHDVIAPVNEEGNIIYAYFVNFFRKNKNFFPIEEIKKANTYEKLQQLYYDALQEKPQFKNYGKDKLEDIFKDIKYLFSNTGIEVKCFDHKSRGLVVKIYTNESDELKANVCATNQESISSINSVAEYLKSKKRYIPDWFFDDFYRLEMFRYPTDPSLTRKPIFYSALCQGEKEILALFSGIFAKIAPQDLKDPNAPLGLLDSRQVALLIDEPTNSFHPEWQRKFIDYLNDFIENLPEEKGYRYADYAHSKKRVQSVIITTHSPFILSDVVEEDVIFLKKNANGLCNQMQKDEVKIKTFGSNINALLVHPFFMEKGVMGEFALKKIAAATKFFSENNIVAQNIDENKKVLETMDKDNFIRKLILNNVPHAKAALPDVLETEKQTEKRKGMEQDNEKV